MEIAVLLGTVVAAGAILWFAAWRASRIEEEWRRAAQTIGATFQPGGFFSHQSMRGRIYGLPFVLETFTRGSGRNSSTWTRLRVHYPAPLDLGLRITREGFWSFVSKLFGAQDVEVGDPAFDSMALIKSNSPARTREWLTPARRLRIARLLDSYPNVEIGDSAVEWAQRGVLRKADRIVGLVKALVRVARHAGVDLEDDQELERALDARARGRPDEALKILREIPGEPGDDAKLVEAEVLYLGGQTEQAKEVLARVVAAEPGDAQAGGWMEVASSPRPAGPPSHVPEAAPLEDPAPMLAALFVEGAMNFDITRTFEREHRGRSVRWRGRLEGVESYMFDMVFGNEPGTRAVVALCELESVRFGDRKVRAVVQLPEEVEGAIKTAGGATVEVTGRLERVDPLTRTLYLGGGRLEQLSLA